MKTFTSKDIEDYYDHTEIHYRMFWKLEESLGLHYGIWDEKTKSTTEAILNTNRQLLALGGITQKHNVLDAGCGIGGSSIFLAKQVGCTCIGITLSKRQVKTATAMAAKNKVDHLVRFEQTNYLNTGFNNESFDIIWAIESFGSSPNKDQFFKEMHRILKPGGKILFADTFKPLTKSIANNKEMQTMLNGWAITDILSIEELETMAMNNHFAKEKIVNVSDKIVKSVNRIYYAAWLGRLGTKLYTLFKDATHFSRIHYKTGLAQKVTFNRKDWGYYLVCLIKG